MQYREFSIMTDFIGKESWVNSVTLWSSQCKCPRHATSGGEGAGLLCSFLKIEKKCLDFAKKVSWFLKNVAYLCVSYGLNSHSNAVSRACWRKNTNIFPCGALHLCVIHETFIEMPLFQENSCLRASYLWIGKRHSTN